MTVFFTRYDAETGRIHSSGTCDNSGYELQGSLYPDLALTQQASDPEFDFVLDGMVIPRPTLAFDKLTIKADGVDEATLPDLPDSCEVVVDGEVHVVEGGTLTITSDLPALYVIEIKAFPYMDFKGVVEAVEVQNED